jgi:hypothetical protein
VGLRETQLRQVLSHFSTNQKTQPQPLIRYALGDQGKSQIALDYCRQSREAYRGIFWIRTNSETSATQSYGMIAAALVGESSADSNDAEVQIRLVKDSLKRWHEPWLPVFDNYDETEKFRNVKRFIRHPSRGSSDDDRRG